MGIYIGEAGALYIESIANTQSCRSEEGNLVNLRPILHIPFDPDLFHELNVERYELSKTGKILYNHPQGTHDDRFWALALAVYVAEQANHPPSKPIAHTIYRCFKIDCVH